MMLESIVTAFLTISLACGCGPSATPKIDGADLRVDVDPNPDPDPYPFCGVPSFAWTEPEVVARSAQPPMESLSCLQDGGIGAIVNLRSEYPGYDEASAVEALGMEYLNLPIVDDTAPSPAQVTEYFAFVADRQGEGKAVLAHCAGGRGRAGFMEGAYLLWQGWSTADVLDRYIAFGAKIDCDNGGNGQIQALHELGIVLDRGNAWPKGTDQYGNVWEDCARPAYMAAWDYEDVQLPMLPGLFLPLVFTERPG